MYLGVSCWYSCTMYNGSTGSHVSLFPHNAFIDHGALKYKSIDPSIDQWAQASAAGEADNGVSCLCRPYCIGSRTWCVVWVDGDMPTNILNHQTYDDPVGPCLHWGVGIHIYSVRPHHVCGEHQCLLPRPHRCGPASIPHIICTHYRYLSPHMAGGEHTNRNSITNCHH